MLVQRIRNIGISAHIDSGKTTLSERILFYTGRIHRIVEVKDKHGGNATLDFTELEAEKGITIQSAATFAEWDGHTIHLVDTPGHVDFTIEVERALRVLDGAVMVLCAVAGVQSQSYTVDRQMRRYGVPRVAFVNKLDRAGADPHRVVAQLRERLGLNPVLMQLPIGLESEFAGLVDVLTARAVFFDGEHGEQVRTAPIPAAMAAEAADARVRLIDAVANVDDALAERVLADAEIGADEVVAALRRATLSMRATPVFLGSALANKGVQTLLDGVVDYLPSPLDRRPEALDRSAGEAAVPLVADPEAPLVALVFKVEEQRFGQLSWVRIYQGCLSKGSFVVNTTTGQRVKIPRLVRIHADQVSEIASAEAGDIVALFGLPCGSGDTLTEGADWSMTSMHVPEPVISVAIAPARRDREAAFAKALQRFTREDPTLRMQRDAESGETLLSGMGELHLDIVTERMRREYDCEVTVSAPRVRFRETITATARFDYLHRKQDGGTGQYARVAGRLEPLPVGQEPAFEFVDTTAGGAIPKSFLKACEQGFRAAIQRGSFGYPVIGVRVVVEDGDVHVKDSSELAFHVAARAAFREVYADAQPRLLEPIMRAEVRVPAQFQGTVLGQLAQRRGMVTSNETAGGFAQITAEVPLAELARYTTDLRSATQGQGEFTMELAAYRERR